MPLRAFIFCCLTLVALSLSGCGGSTDPINKDKDRPIKKDKDK